MAQNYKEDKEWSWCYSINKAYFTAGINSVKYHTNKDGAIKKGLMGGNNLMKTVLLRRPIPNVHTFMTTFIT